MIIPRMLHVFEVYVAPGHDPDAILSKETLEETRAQVMTQAEATAVGFSGITDPTPGRVLRFIAVNHRDSQWIHRKLESNHGVTSYKVHEVG